MRDACDVLAGVHAATGGVDGRVSIEVAPTAHDTAGTIAQARELHDLVDRDGVLIKIPATAEGLPAIAETLATGISVNVTLIFSVDRYREVMDAYLTGLEMADAAGLDLARIHSVASFFISRVDVEVDKRLDAAGAPELTGRPASRTPRWRSARTRRCSAGSGSQHWPPKAPTRSGPCGPPPASRTRTTLTRCTSPSSRPGAW